MVLWLHTSDVAASLRQEWHVITSAPHVSSWAHMCGHPWNNLCMHGNTGELVGTLGISKPRHISRRFRALSPRSTFIPGSSPCTTPSSGAQALLKLLSSQSSVQTPSLFLSGEEGGSCHLALRLLCCSSCVPKTQPSPTLSGCSFPFPFP
jgi:hypothetical protein